MSSIVNGVKRLAVRASSATGGDGPLFEPVTVGRYQLKSRLVYAPLTRCRAFDNIPQPAAAQYYSERAREGTLMLTEATPVLQQGQGYPCVPGIYTQEQVEAWKPIVKAVKGKGAVFWMQLWHVGRSSHQDYQPNGDLPVAPSALAITNGSVYAPKLGKMDEFPVPRALEASELPGIAEAFAQGARNALDAGFEGVEIHGANGYLLDQFLKQSSNKRSDEYGGSIENRVRFVLEVVDAVVRATGDGQKVGIRLSPYSTEFGQCYEPDVASTIELNVHLLKELSKRNLAYAHIVTARAEGASDAEAPDLVAKSLKPFREAFTSGRIIAAGGFLRESAEQELASGDADLITFGRWWLANPDFPERLRENQPFNKYDRNTFYTQDQVVGYTDYPSLKDISDGAPTETHYSGQLVFASSK